MELSELLVTMFDILAGDGYGRQTICSSITAGGLIATEATAGDGCDAVCGGAGVPRRGAPLPDCSGEKEAARPGPQLDRLDAARFQ